MADDALEVALEIPVATVVVEDEAVEVAELMPVSTVAYELDADEVAETEPVNEPDAVTLCVCAADATEVVALEALEVALVT